MMHRLVRAAAAVLVVATAVFTAFPAGAQEAPGNRPMIFVHGFMGSGMQFEAQALRFTSNGFPADHIEVFEHDSLAWPGSQTAVWGRLDEQIADLLAATGADQVDLLGHSQGTGVVQGYLNSDPSRAAQVAHYVNLDGGAGGTVPADVETLAVWGEGDPSREIPGATNVRFPDQAHTEVVNSPETFVEIHRFLTGTEPAVDDVVRADDDSVEVSGRVQLFPQNAGATDATLRIYEVEPATGERLDETPISTVELAGDGAWGPVDVDPDAYHEFAVTRDASAHHIYAQPFPRDNRWVHLLTSEPGGLADSFWEVTDDHSNLVIFRNKEWWGDQGAAGDTLAIDGQSILNAAISPRANRTIGIFVHDNGVDATSDLSAPVAPTGLPFLTGVDLFIPAASPPEATVGIVATPRLGDGPEAVCIPNWASSTDRSSVQFASYHHLVDSDGNPTEGHPAPACASPAARPGGPSTPAPAAPATPVVADPAYTG